MEKPTHDIEAARLHTRDSLNAYCFTMAVVLGVTGLLIYGLSYWGCPESTSCQIYALQMTAGILCALVIPLKVNPWLQKFTAHIQAKTLRFWSILAWIVYFLVPCVVLAAAFVSPSEGIIHQTLASAMNLVKYMADPRPVALLHGLLLPYLFPDSNSAKWDGFSIPQPLMEVFSASSLSG